MDGERAFNQLIGQVDQAATGDDPLSRLEAAVSVGAAVSGRADRLLDHFVQQARRAGHSWTEIGRRLGVSKQAARQRFADRTETLAFRPELRPRLRACLAQAQREAEADGSTEVGTQHLLAGLMAEGVAAAILEQLDVITSAIRDASHRLFGPPAEPRTAAPPMSLEATCALDTATHHAAIMCPDQTGRDTVGTEHLLAALALDPGSRARRVLNDLGVDIAAIKRKLGNPKPRRRRWWQHRPEATAVCSFCGRPEAVAGRLVAGPSICICAGCVRLASDILDNDFVARYRDHTGFVRTSELAAQANVNPQTLRYYERLGSLPQPARTPGATAATHLKPSGWCGSSNAPKTSASPSPTSPRRRR